MTILCEYGCGEPAIHQLKNKKWCCSRRTSSCPIIKKKCSEGLIRAYISGKKIPAAETYKNLPQEVKDKMNWNKGNYSNTQFIYNGTGNHKKALIQERGHQCEDCKSREWKNQPIPLELEHSDGDTKNNAKENLRLLCCNCHALTPTWRGRNINSGKVKITDEELLTALRECSNIRQALQSVGLAAKGGNYERAKKLLQKIAPVS